MKKSTKLLSAMMLFSMMAMPVSFSTNAFERGDHQADHGRGHGQNKMQRLLRKLDLTDSQQEKIKAIFEQQKTNRQAHKETMKTFKDQMKSLMSAAVFDDAAFISLHNEYQSQFTEAALQRAKTHHAILQVLDKSQREKLIEMKKRGKGLFH